MICPTGWHEWGLDTTPVVWGEDGYGRFTITGRLVCARCGYMPPEEEADRIQEEHRRAFAESMARLEAK